MFHAIKETIDFADSYSESIFMYPGEMTLEAMYVQSPAAYASTVTISNLAREFTVKSYSGADFSGGVMLELDPPRTLPREFVFTFASDDSDEVISDGTVTIVLMGKRG